MERLLKQKAKKGRMGWIYSLSALAAVLLVFLSLWLTPNKIETGSQQQQNVQTPQNKGQKDTQTGAVSLRQQNRQIPASARSAASLTGQGDQLALLTTRSGGLPRPAAVSNDGMNPPNNVVGLQAHYANINPSFSGTFGGQLSVQNSNRLPKDDQPGASPLQSPDLQLSVNRGKWALSLAVSPDVNAVQGSDNGMLGTSMGIGLSYRVGKALSVGTGIYYSKKVYSANKESYKTTIKPFATWTSYSKRIDADCRVIDVPLNLTLRLSNTARNQIYASAGMSSYVMLSEKYDFIYNNPSPAFPTGRREYTIRNENKHLLSVVNLSLALEQPLSEKVSLVIQPYAKLPLTGIGQGETQLRSFGLGMKLNYSMMKK